MKRSYTIHKINVSKQILAYTKLNEMINKVKINVYLL